MILEGTVLAGPGYDPVEGRVVVEDGHVESVEETETDSTDIVLPAFVNAHTHVGDSIAKEAGGGLSLEELVAPPDGLKHRLLAEASREEMVEAIRRSLRFMERAGTAAFLDFRENDVEGVEILREAVSGRAIEPRIFARGSPEAMEAGDGFGASGAKDADFSIERNATRRAGKPFAIHAGEADSADVNPALDLDPDFLVHMVHTEPLHLERLEERGTPVVVCPRSNLVTGVGVPNVRELLDTTTVALGTDNVFLNAPSMFREMEFTAKLCDVSATEVLRMATRAGAEFADLNCGTVEAGREARLIVLDGDSDNLAGAQDVVRAVVRRAGVADVKSVLLERPDPTA
ncbi:amidohydrolase family protein [Salinirubellus salinus]|uniref:Amidohydrolase family protein n=1 Tax=Salinirubellus salinus TaxID=1364945 RepID=A0A9E7R615_9EURY|nr:amidohydrolase family protein [Salinirubellus salinus]UWM56262.1 amidohydrolase family protein [Salinirubellus salinus]